LDGGSDSTVAETPEGKEADDGKRAGAIFLDILIPLVMLAAVAGLTKLPDWPWFVKACGWVAEQLTAGLQRVNIPVLLGEEAISRMVLWALPAMACFFFIDRPLRFGLCVAALLLVSYVRQSDTHAERTFEIQTVKTERSFFGILKVEEVRTNVLNDEGQPTDEKVVELRRLVHGTTLHGMQAPTAGILSWRYVSWFVDALEAVTGSGAVRGWSLREEPITYYHRTGPVGDMFRVLRAKDPKAPFAMVGLGTGSVSCYALPGQSLTFYEIDPSVKQLVADDDTYFTYFKDAQRRGANVDIVMGDARLKLEEQADRRYQLLLVDAFSSDSIPIHLLTKEAVKLYMDRVTDDGIVALHISNKFVKLEPVVARIADELGLEARVFSDMWDTPIGKTMSSWVVLARKPEHLGAIARKDGPGAVGENWKPLELDENVKAWTDDYSDVLSVIMIKEIQKVRQFFGMPVAKGLAKPE
jgi:hypothetical protein